MHMHHVTEDRCGHELTACAQGVGIMFAVNTSLFVVDGLMNKPMMND